MERFAQQDAAQKATTEQLDALAAILAPLIGNLNNPTVAIKRQLFNTDQTVGVDNQPNGTGKPTTSEPYKPQRQCLGS